LRAISSDDAGSSATVPALEQVVGMDCIYDIRSFRSWNSTVRQRLRLPGYGRDWLLRQIPDSRPFQGFETTELVLDALEISYLQCIFYGPAEMKTGSSHRFANISQYRCCAFCLALKDAIDQFFLREVEPTQWISLNSVVPLEKISSASKLMKVGVDGKSFHILLTEGA
jgi:hypothetical protein